MTDVATLLGEFLDELNAGRGPEAAAFIEKAGSEADRIALAQSIEAVLAFAPESTRHPQGAASGALASPLDASQLAAAFDEVMGSSGELVDVVPSWRETFGASVAEFAQRVLAAGGLAITDGNVTVASKWVDGMESGAIGAERLSDRAMRAVSSVLGSGPDAELAVQGFEMDLAFRAEDYESDDAVAEKLGDIADVLSDAMQVSDEDVDAWFAGDE